MTQRRAEASPPEQWTLIRGARQLLTLRGASGPRRGSDMGNLGSISNGAILIHNGIIETVGTARQVENRAPARHATEIDAAGGIVMPAFVDPDAALAAPTAGPAGDRQTEGQSPGLDIRRMSGHRLRDGATSMAGDLACYGVLSIGAHTLFAPDLRNTTRVLRLHKAMQSRPIRIRSVFSPPWAAGDAESRHFERLTAQWLPAVSDKQLAPVLEVPMGASWVEDARALASAGALCGFATRFRVFGPPTRALLDLACAAGSIALLGIPPEHGMAARALADIGCVQVALAAQILAGQYASARAAVDGGMSLAIASGYRPDGTASLNPQFLQYLACQSLGLTADEAIMALTYNAACSLRLSHVTGSLEPGKSADICVMDVDDYHELARRVGHHDARLVLRAGNVVYRRPRGGAE